jgi:hypothetical protein
MKAILHSPSFRRLRRLFKWTRVKFVPLALIVPILVAALLLNGLAVAAPAAEPAAVGINGWAVYNIFSTTATTGITTFFTDTSKTVGQYGSADCYYVTFMQPGANNSFTPSVQTSADAVNWVTDGVFVGNAMTNSVIRASMTVTGLYWRVISGPLGTANAISATIKCVLKNSNQ